MRCVAVETLRRPVTGVALVAFRPFEGAASCLWAISAGCSPLWHQAPAGPTLVGLGQFPPSLVDLGARLPGGVRIRACWHPMLHQGLALLGCERSRTKWCKGFWRLITTRPPKRANVARVRVSEVMDSPHKAVPCSGCAELRALCRLRDMNR